MFVPRVLLALAVFGVTASAQSVVSAHSGVIHFSEGSVFLDDQPVEHRVGRFAEMKPGSELRTEWGHAEVLLTPGMFLRIGDNSAIRMVSNRLSDTRVKLLHGSAVVESLKSSPGTSVTILCKDVETRFERPGLYRFNAEPAELRVEQGEAEVRTQGSPTTVAAGESLLLTDPKAAPQSTADAGDALDRWSMRRSIAVAANDAAAAQADDMAVMLDTPVDPFGLGPSYSVGPYATGIGAYPYGYGYPALGLGSYYPMGLLASPFLVLPRYRAYSPINAGYGNYRFGIRPVSPVQVISPGAFRPMGRGYTTPNRPLTISPGGAGHAVGHVGGAHR